MHSGKHNAILVLKGFFEFLIGFYDIFSPFYPIIIAGLNSERIQTTDIQDFENSEDANDNQDIKDQVASTDDGITDDSSGSHESAAQKAKETVSDNRGVQLGLIIGGILFAGIVIVILVSRRMGKEEISAVTTKTEISQTAEEQEDGSLDQSKEQHADDIKEPKP